MSYFDERYILYGDIYNSKTKVEGVRCELIVNAVDTSSMRAIISAFRGNLSQVNNLFSFGESIQFESKDSQERIWLEGDIPSMSIGGYDDEILKFSVRTCVFEDIYKEQPINHLHFAFRIPGVHIYERKNSLYKHYKKGLLCGWKDIDFKEDSNKDKWIDEEYIINTELVPISFCPILLYKESRIDEFETTLVIDQISIQCNIDVQNSSLNQTEQKIVGVINDHLHILSFLENDRINWFYYSVYGEGEDNKTVFRKRIYKWIPKPANKFRDKNHYWKFRSSYHELHKTLTKAYQNLNEENKKKIDDAIERFIVASTAETIDSQLIYWHSCLDILWKIAKGDGPSFSHRLMDACKQQNVEWLDLYPQMTGDAIKTGANFPINKIRNEMLHEGHYPNNYEVVFEEMRRTRALCERFITRCMGIDYKDTGIGQNRI